MSDFKKKVNSYRLGDDWQSNFKYIDYHNVANSVKSILTKKELDRKLDRLGNHSGTSGHYKHLSLDERVFRLCVLLDTQAKDILANSTPQQIIEARGAVQEYEYPAPESPVGSDE